MSLPKHIEITVGFVKEHQEKCFSASLPEEKSAEAQRVKDLLYDIYREVDKLGLAQPRNRRRDHKSLLGELDKHISSFARLSEDPQRYAFFEGVPCSKLLEDLRALWYEP